MSRGFEGILDDIRCRDDDDVVGLNRKKKVETKEGEDQVPDQPAQEEKPIFGGYVKESEEIIGAGAISILGMGFLKGLNGLFKK
jgi:hypothetical protein